MTAFEFRRKTLAASFAVSAIAMMAGSFPATAQESTDPIKLTLHDWTGQLITTHLMYKIWAPPLR